MLLQKTPSVRQEEFRVYMFFQKPHIDEVSFPNDTLTYLKSDMSLLNGVVYSELGELGEFINGEREGRHKRWY